MAVKLIHNSLTDAKTEKVSSKLVSKLVSAVTKDCAIVKVTGGDWNLVPQLIEVSAKFIEANSDGAEAGYVIATKGGDITVIPTYKKSFSLEEYEDELASLGRVKATHFFTKSGSKVKVKLDLNDGGNSVASPKPFKGDALFNARQYDERGEQPKELGSLEHLTEISSDKTAPTQANGYRGREGSKPLNPNSKPKSTGGGPGSSNYRK